MRIELEPLKLQNFQLTPEAKGGVLTLQNGRKSFSLNPLQYSYLDVLKNGTSIEGLVQFYLGQGWLVSFRELYNLIQFLLKEAVIQNPSFYEYFVAQGLQDYNASTSPFQNVDLKEDSLNPRALPFFRSLDPQLSHYLLQKSQRIKVAANTRVVRTGTSDRDLYIILSGEAAVYRVLSETQRQRLATLKDGSLFGERAFLLNQPRSADIITQTHCELLKISHLSEFDQLIKTEKAQSLQHRFWVQQALTSSEFFKNLPSNTLDMLTFRGRLVQAPAHQVLFYEGQPGNTCYILIQGNVVVSQQGRNINVLPQGSCFGEISLLVSGGVRTATVTTQQDSVLLEIHQNDFYQILTQNLILAKEIEELANQRIAADHKRY